MPTMVSSRDRDRRGCRDPPAVRQGLGRGVGGSFCGLVEWHQRVVDVDVVDTVEQPGGQDITHTHMQPRHNMTTRKGDKHERERGGGGHKNKKTRSVQVHVKPPTSCVHAWWRGWPCSAPEKRFLSCYGHSCYFLVVWTCFPLRGTLAPTTSKRDSHLEKKTTKFYCRLHTAVEGKQVLT